MQSPPTSAGHPYDRTPHNTTTTTANNFNNNYNNTLTHDAVKK
jgi:hypothetical protein